MADSRKRISTPHPSRAPTPGAQKKAPHRGAFRLRRQASELLGVQQVQRLAAGAHGGAQGMDARQ
ncbi:Uncharacterised protein [Acinetobacter baumannii]|nr:Uncharacterised protein [Acinetobacter baumannii]